MFQENIGLEREKRDLPITYQREMDKKGIGNTYDFKVLVITYRNNTISLLFFRISNFMGSFKNRRKTSSDVCKTPSKPTSTKR